MQLLNVKVQRDLKVEDDVNEYKCRFLRNRVQELKWLLRKSVSIEEEKMKLFSEGAAEKNRIFGHIKKTTHKEDSAWKFIPTDQGGGTFKKYGGASWVL